MAKKPIKKKATRKIHKARRRHFLLRREILLVILAVALLGTGFYLKQKVAFYYAIYFNKFEHKKLSNSEFEEQRINKIVEDYVDYGLPVGSKTIIERHNVDVSPATIRNEMKQLESFG